MCPRPPMWEEMVVGTDPGLIEIAGLKKTFGTVRAVDDLSFTVPSGTVTGFLGPNGAGKTTTLRCLLGLVTPTSGTATIGGVPYARLPHPSATVGAMLEAASFHPGRSGRDHLRVYCTINGFPDSRADEVLGLVGLTGPGKDRVAGYSMGMRQRLGLAAALLGDPRVLILDEPANGLDPEGIAWLRGFIRKMADEGRTVLVSSHVLSEVEQTVDNVVIISRGSLVRQGTIAELADSHGTAVLVRGPEMPRLAAALPEHVTATESAGGLRIVGSSTDEIGHVAFTERIELSELAAERSDLEDIFLALTVDGGQR